MTPIIATLYCLSLVFLPSFAVFVLVKDWRTPINRHFAVLCLALFGWVATLLAFYVPLSSSALLWDGRLNFAFMALALPPGYLFVRELARTGTFAPWVIWTEAVVVSLVSLFTPLVDKAESVSASGVHSTALGPLFPAYAAFCVGTITVGLAVSLRPSRRAASAARAQLRFIAAGIAATTAIATVTNVLLPSLGNFSLIEIGPASVVLFLAAVGSATFVLHLFDVHVIIRATVVYAGLIALALELYSLSLSALARLIPLGPFGERETAATAIVLVINAFTQEPIRRWLVGVAGRRSVTKPR